ncbi:MAG TPA: glutathione S-transferase N-terminal domain-containing protein [Allosphingosinicella sp.]|nr:glutathione S-transferase N-terminal domain-containing protein [Allosphingosinicella sp.]
MLRLFYSPGAVSLVPHIALEETGAPFDAVRVTIAEGAHWRPDYLAVNPRGLVPALEVDGRVVAETPSILTMIGRLHPQSGLFPTDDPFAEARLLELMSFFASSVHPGFARLFRAARSSWGASLPAAMVADDRAILERFFGDIDALLAQGPWLLGEPYSVADGYPYVFLRWARRQAFETRRFRNWTEHARRMAERPAVRRAIAREGLDVSEF